MYCLCQGVSVQAHLDANNTYQYLIDKRLDVWMVWYVCVKWTCASCGWIASYSTTFAIAAKCSEFTLFEQLAQRLLIVSTNINGFSLASHRPFTKHSCYTVWQYQSTSIKIYSQLSVLGLSSVYLSVLVNSWKMMTL